MLKIIVLFTLIKLCFCGCPNGTETSYTDPNKCYIFVGNKSDFINAEGFCIQQGGHLSSVTSAFENLYLSSKASLYFVDSTDADFWIGATNELTPGNWSWLDGTPFSYTDWMKGQPENITASSCASSSITTSLWSAEDCFKTKSFACLTPAPTPTTTTTTMQTTTTKRIPSCEPGWYLFETTGFCYLPKWQSNSINWQDAENYCIKQNSHLASIHTQIESDYIADLVRTKAPMYDDCNINAPWIGLYTVTNHQSWAWTDGTPSDFGGWSPGEPNNHGDSENCVELLLKNCNNDHMNYWNDIQCKTYLHYYVCKKAKSYKLVNADLIVNTI